MLTYFLSIDNIEYQVTKMYPGTLENQYDVAHSIDVQIGFMHFFLFTGTDF